MRASHLALLLALSIAPPTPAAHSSPVAASPMTGSANHHDVVIQLRTRDSHASVSNGSGKPVCRQ